MSFQSDIADCLDELVTELTGTLGAPTFTWKGVEVPCVPDESSRGTMAVSGGHEDIIALKIRVKRSHFRSVDTTLETVDSELITMDNNMPHPVAGRTTVFRGKDYKILTASEDSSRAFYKLELGDKHSGR